MEKPNSVIIRPKANIGNTLWAKRTAFTRSAITQPKVSLFGCSLENCEPNVGGWPWQILGAIRAVAILFVFSVL